MAVEEYMISVESSCKLPFTGDSFKQLPAAPLQVTQASSGAAGIMQANKMRLGVYAHLPHSIITQAESQLKQKGWRVT